MGRGEGFQMPVNFKVRFGCPRGIDDPNSSIGISKVKPNGLFAGHDWNSVEVQGAILKFRGRKDIGGDWSRYDNTWAWIK